jgi:transcription antitermination factor NusG
MNTSVTHLGEALPDHEGHHIEMPQEPGAEASWFAVHTRPRYERKVERQLRERGIVSFLPVVRETHKWSDRLKTIDAPMFPCYLFVRISTAGHARSTVLGVPGVAGFVGVRRAALPIPAPEVEALQRLVASQLDCQPHFFVTTGQRVRILGGCLDGVEGQVVRYDGGDRLVIAVSGIRRAVAVCVQGYDFELIPTDAS